MAGQRTPATTLLDRRGISYRLHSYPHDPRAESYGAEAAVADAERATGYVAGGISPLGHRKRLPVVIDTSATGHATVFCSAGRRGLELELAPAALARATQATLAAISSVSPVDPGRG